MPTAEQLAEAAKAASGFILCLEGHSKESLLGLFIIAFTQYQELCELAVANDLLDGDKCFEHSCALLQGRAIIDLLKGSPLYGHHNLVHQLHQCIDNAAKRIEVTSAEATH